MTARALVTLAKLLKERGILAAEEIDYLIENLNPEFDEIYADEMTPQQPGVFRAAKFKVEHDLDLEHAVTFAFKDLAIIVLRKRQEGT